MKPPLARPVPPQPEADEPTRLPRAFTSETSQVHEVVTDPFDNVSPDALALPPPRRPNWAARLAWGAGGVLVSLGLALAAERLVRDLYARYEWLGWLGIGALGLLVLAIVILAGREIAALSRLRNLDRLRTQAEAVLLSDQRDAGRAILAELHMIYQHRPDLARARHHLMANGKDLFDGSEIVRLSERVLMAPLDARAKVLTAASARRVALVTTVSPRALVDLAFVIYESIRLGGAIAALYGSRPGFFGFWRLTGAILGHLAVTGGLALTDGVVEQLVGQGLAAKLSARLGEGLVNGLMTVRVGIAAMRVVRPLPFDTQKQPMVKDFMAELANVTQSEAQKSS